MKTETKTKEHPILFSGPMVKAILDGSKTQTRRVVRFPSWFDDGGFPEQFDGYQDYRPVESGDILWHCTNRYGYPGDRLWVRESFGYADGDVYYKSDGHPGFVGWKWSPSIHMPRLASRLTLEVTDVRAERVHDITEEDAIAEGVDAVSIESVPRQGVWNRRQDFAQLWDKLNSTRGFGWDENPWVWVITFRRMEKTP